jgi:biotin carboxylase
MKILVLHRVPYFKIEYHRGIDHDRHDVTYFGTVAALATLPPDLRCTRVSRPGEGSACEEARSWLAGGEHAFDRIISMSEYELLDAARLRELFGVPGAPVEQVMLARDKVLMKRAVARAGIRVPRFLPLVEFLERQGVAAWWGATVLKPHRGASSEDVVVFADPAQAYAAVTEARSGVAALDQMEGGRAGYQVEEFVNGPIRHYDGLVQNGSVVTLEASEYVGTCLGYAQGHPLGSVQIECPPDTHAWVDRALAAVEIHNGSFHLEAILAAGGELVFLEVGNRVGGADVVATYELATGIHLPTFELRILLGESVTGQLPAAPASRSWYGWFVYPAHHLGEGRFDGFDGAESVAASPQVVTWTELAAGAPLPTHVTYGAGETALAGIAVGNAPAEIREWMEQMFRSLRIRSSASALSARTTR